MALGKEYELWHCPPPPPPPLLCNRKKGSQTGKIDTKPPDSSFVTLPHENQDYDFFIQVSKKNPEKLKDLKRIKIHFYHVTFFQMVLNVWN